MSQGCAGYWSGRRQADVVEDCEWMNRWGESLQGAARRLGYANEKSLRNTLQRAGQYELAASLQSRNPLSLISEWED